MTTRGSRIGIGSGRCEGGPGADVHVASIRSPASTKLPFGSGSGEMMPPIYVVPRRVSGQISSTTPDFLAITRKGTVTRTGGPDECAALTSDFGLGK
jgi:hypothetical protein